ncbi:MAG: lipoprotein signal peptidase [Solitalea sp.]
MKRSTKAILLIFLVLLIDQASKTWIKNNMHLGEEFKVLGDFFLIHFTENNGMAFGLEFAGEYGKLFLTVFRLVAVGVLGYGVHYAIKNRYHWGFVYCLSLILAGALGNIIDSVFYGLIYGYAPILHGRVVDMLYFPIIRGYYPDWFPFWGGESFIFFRPVFNIADSAISVGVILILIFQKTFFESQKERKNDLQSEVIEV